MTPIRTALAVSLGLLVTAAGGCAGRAANVALIGAGVAFAVGGITADDGGSAPYDEPGDGQTTPDLDLMPGASLLAVPGVVMIIVGVIGLARTPADAPTADAPRDPVDRLAAAAAQAAAAGDCPRVRALVDAMLQHESYLRRELAQDPRVVACLR